MEYYSVQKYNPRTTLIKADVPASKSILNRAIILSAFGNGEVLLSCGAFAEDTRALLSCLTALGISWEKTSDGLRIIGCNGNIPNRRAQLNVQSAGTAARFLTATLAFLGGEYTMHSSAQMEARPMEILSVLEQHEVKFEYLGQHGHFPFRMFSNGISSNVFTVDTDLSTQYASGILLAASFYNTSLTLHLTGQRTHGSYIEMTLSLLRSFGADWTREGNVIHIYPASHSPKQFEIEGDLSGACYFYAMALLLSSQVLVRRIHPDTLQGDKKFLDLLAARGVIFTDSADGLIADGRNVTAYNGFCENMRDYSDQALTVAALAPFAVTPTHIYGIGHIRRQECDRIHAIVENLHTLGVPATEETDGVHVSPSCVNGGIIEAYGDHRVAMAFALIGLKTGNVIISDPKCCRKTFENYFEILDKLTEPDNIH